MSGAEPARRPPESIVVTGLGAVTAYGWGIPALWEGVLSGDPAIGPFDRFDPAPHRTHLAAQVDLGSAPERPGPRTSVADRFAIAAAREAVASARLDCKEAPERLGVWFGSSTGGMLESELYFESLVRRGSRSARPGLLAAQQFNGPGDAVARDLGARGPVVTISSACSSGAMAIGAAFRALRRGEVDVAIAGGADSLCQLTYAGFNALRSVDERPSRPFRKDRQGLSLGEGAGILVLEREDRPRSRAVPALAALAGEAATCDAHHMTAPHPEGRGAGEAIVLALADAGVDPAEVDFVNAHGTGTPLNDAAEATALRRVFGDRVSAIPLTSTKALIGHLLGSAGAVEAAVTVLCLARRQVHPMPDVGEIDPGMPLDLVLGVPRRLGHAQVAISISLAFGGTNAALVFRREPRG